MHTLSVECLVARAAEYGVSLANKCLCLPNRSLTECGPWQGRRVPTRVHCALLSRRERQFWFELPWQMSASLPLQGDSSARPHLGLAEYAKYFEEDYHHFALLCQNCKSLLCYFGRKITRQFIGVYFNLSRDLPWCLAYGGRKFLGEVSNEVGWRAL